MELGSGGFATLRAQSLQGSCERLWDLTISYGLHLHGHVGVVGWRCCVLWRVAWLLDPGQVMPVTTVMMQRHDIVVNRTLCMVYFIQLASPSKVCRRNLGSACAVQSKPALSRTSAAQLSTSPRPSMELRPLTKPSTTAVLLGPTSTHYTVTMHR